MQQNVSCHFFIYSIFCSEIITATSILGQQNDNSYFPYYNHGSEPNTDITLQQHITLQQQQRSPQYEAGSEVASPTQIYCHSGTPIFFLKSMAQPTGCGSQIGLNSNTKSSFLQNQYHL